MTVVSIIISSFKRPNLLKWNLHSLSKQSLPFEFETIVLNDGVNDGSKDICKKYTQKLNLRYFFTGHRNLDGKIKWRVPGFAYNIGAQLSKGEILILSCAEMFHLNNTIENLSSPLLSNPKLIGLPIGMDDTFGRFLNHLQRTNGQYDLNDFYTNYARLDNLPFLISVSREEFFSIGGYDEDFTGLAFDDNDLIHRLKANGCSFCETQAETIHLYHPRHVHGKGESPEFLYNQSLYQERKQQIVRNQNRSWGKL